MNGTVVLCTHESVWGSVPVTPCSFNVNHRWSGQLHAPAALLPGEVPAVLFEKEAVWAPDPIWTVGRRDVAGFPERNSNRGYPEYEAVMLVAWHDG